MHWFHELKDGDTQHLGRFIVEEYSKNKYFYENSKGFVVSAPFYRSFVERNGMQGMLEELLITLDSDQGAVTIEKHFQQSRYDTDEIVSLRRFYYELEKPIVIKAYIVYHTSGALLKEVESHYQDSIVSFDQFSDAVIAIWQKCWSAKTLNVLKTCTALKEGTFPKLDVVLIVCEQSAIEAFDDNQSKVESVDMNKSDSFKWFHKLKQWIG